MNATRNPFRYMRAWQMRAWPVLGRVLQNRSLQIRPLQIRPRPVFCLVLLVLLVAGGVLRPVHQFVQAQGDAAVHAAIVQADELAMALAAPSDLECCAVKADNLPKHWRCMSDLGIFAAGGEMERMPAKDAPFAVLVQSLAGCSGDALLRPPINV